MSVGAADANVAFISLQPQTVPGGVTAIVSNVRSGASVTTSMVDGGMDPIPVPAVAGDSITIEAQAASGAALVTLGNSVPSRRPPKIVRTLPGRGKTGVPLNKTIEVVFTEPVAQASLPSSIRLFQGNAEVSGTATILQGVTAAVVFKPAANLAANTDYELVVTNGVRDLDGDAADSTVRVSFTTGTSIEGPVVSLSIIPDGANLRVGDQFQAVVVAKDAGGNELIGHAIRWYTDTLTAVDVTTTGLVTARDEGGENVFAEVDGLTASINVRVSNALRPVASVMVAFDSGTVAAGGTLQVAALALDADGNLLPQRVVHWSTTNAAIATVAAFNQSPQTDINRAWFKGYPATASAIYWANVTGVANGVARIVATIDNHSDTLVVTVGSSFPVVGFVVPDTATLLLREMAPLMGSSVNSAGGRAEIPATQIQWESSNPAVATVDVNGFVVAAAAGSAIITAHWNTYSAATRVTVVQVTFESLNAGGSYTYAGGHSCGIATDGATYCWGANWAGQVGRPTVAESDFQPAALFYRKPVPVAQGFAFVTLAAGSNYSCGLTAAGAAYCWGRNDSGQLGSNNADDSWRPVAVSGGFSFVEIDAGSGNHTCALTSSGKAYCWGVGGLGITGVMESRVPVAVYGGINFATLSVGGSHTCGLTSDGTAYCWGDNNAGQLGVGQFGNRMDTPVAVSGGLKFATITTGDAHTCGVTLSGSLYCWGHNAFDESGTGPFFDNSYVPAPVITNLKFSVVGAGPTHTCALDVTGNAYCWGFNEGGQLGIGTVTTELFETPQRVIGDLTFDRLSVRGSHTCARSTAGGWYCWGNNETGALGVGSSNSSGTPLKVLGQQ
ncbi:MAG: Ig-like domain-containing protein [Gemmatimonadaceae bacterium]